MAMNVLGHNHMKLSGQRRTILLVLKLMNSYSYVVLFIYLLSISVRDRGHTKGKACTGCFPTKITYNIQITHTYTQDQTN